MYQGTEPKLTDLTDRDYRRSTIILAALVLTALVLKALLLSRFPIHDDEFHYLSQVYEYERGELQTPFQCFHVHFFGWLSTVGENEVTQIIAARIVMYFLLLGTCFYLFRTACHFLGVRAALFCVLCYLCFISTIVNGASFRPDNSATFFIMFALYHFIVREDSVFSNVLAGVAMSVSLLFTIKTAIYLPLFAGWFFSKRLFCDTRSKYLIRTACFLGSLIIAFITLYKLHVATLPQSAAENSSNFLSGTFSTFVTFEQIFPARRWIILTLTIDFLIWFLLLGGLIVHLADLLQRRFTRNEPKAILIVLAIPLLSLLFYRNAYPYFFVFLIPTAIVFCGYTFEFLVSKRKNNKKKNVLFLSVALGLIVLSNFLVRLPRYIRYDAELTTFQWDVLAAIHRMFPKPVPYVDTCSMVSSYPKVGLFMSPAGIRNYQRRALPIMGRVLSEKKPLFLLVNYDFLLDLNLSQPPQPFNGKGLFEADWATLRSYFIHHWGPIWVVGKQFNLGPATELRYFEIIAPGLYTVESKTDIIIDGILYNNGDVVRLEEGSHTIGAGGPITTIRLRWGDHLYRTDSEPEVMHLGASHY